MKPGPSHLRPHGFRHPAAGSPAQSPTATCQPSPYLAIRLALLCLVIAGPAAADGVFPPGHITAVQRDPAGVVRLSLRDPFQGGVIVERSTELRTWDELGAVSLASGVGEFTDDSAPPGLGFYRLAPPRLDYRGRPTVSFEQPSFTVPEAAATVGLPVFRNGSLDGALDVPWRIVAVDATPGDDYEGTEGTVHFNPGSRHATIPLQLKDDAASEEDEVLVIGLISEDVAAAPYPAAVVVIADDDAPGTTLIANAGLQSPYWISNAGPPVLLAHQGRILWNGPADGRVLSVSPGEWAPRVEAASFGVPAHLAAAGPWLVRLDAADGIAGGCTGPGVVGKLVRSALDGSDPLVLDRPALCAAAVPPAMNHDTVFYVDTEVSPERYHLRRVPVHGGTPQHLLTVTRPLRTMLAAGPWLWCTEDGFPDTPGSRMGVLWRVAIDGSGAEEWLTGFRAPAGQLVRDESFIYLADTSYGGVERIHQVSPTERSSRVIWETQDLTRESHIRALALTAGNLWWLDEHSLRTMPAHGGTVRTVVEGVAFPHALAVSASRVAWSEGAPGGSVRRHDLATGQTGTLVAGLRDPGELLFAGETLVFTTGVGYDEGGGQVLALPPGASVPVPVAGGVSVQQPVFTAGGSSLFVADKWTIKRIPGNGGIPAVVSRPNTALTGFAADDHSLYLAAEPQGDLLAMNHDGSQMRLLAAAGGRPVLLQADGSRLFWIDEPSRLRSVATVGGEIADVLADRGAISNYLLDADAAYVALQDAGQLVRVPKTGGTVTVLAGLVPFQFTALAQTDSLVLWAEGNAIRAVPKTGGTPQVLANNLPETPSALASDGQRVVWLEAATDRLRALTLP